jgi:hypothetical protein
LPSLVAGSIALRLVRLSSLLWVVVTMLSDEEVMDAFQSAPDGIAGLRAVEAAVRADMQQEVQTVEELRKDLAECGRLAGQIMFPEDAEAARIAILDVTRKHSWLPVTPSTPNQTGAEQ